MTIDIETAGEYQPFNSLEQEIAAVAIAGVEHVSEPSLGGRVIRMHGISYAGWRVM